MEYNFASKKWKKNWDGGWSILTCSYLGYQYTKQLFEVIGISVRESLFVSHNDISACYFLDEYKKDFGVFIADKAIKKPEVILEWAQKLKSATDYVLKLIEDLKTKEASLQNFELFIAGMYEYGVSHRLIKVVVDYLPEDIFKKYLDIMSEARIYAEPVYEETEKYMRYFAKEIGQKENLKPELILATTKAQFLAYFKDGKFPSVEMLQEQYENSVLYVDEKGEQLVFGKENVVEIEQAIIKNNETKEITGQIAYKGKVQGKVRIILDATKPHDFDEGDILVTGMTRPDYIPYIKKSAGFITDAGGILSHAAISARELQKPCIIGTEVATKLLKDGQIVEIDAEKGVVNIIG